MKVLQVKPRLDDDDRAANSGAPPISLKILFAGIPVTSETEVIVEATPSARVGDLTRVISEFCVSQRSGGSAGASSASSAAVADIKLNLAGKMLTDPKERIDHAVSRSVGSAAVKSTAAIKLFVSGKFMSSGDAAANQMSSGVGAPGAAAAAVASRRDRAADPDVSPEAADAYAHFIASNPAMMQMIIESDPALKEAMRTNPELRRQLSDPDTIRDMIRNQLSRDGRRSGDAAIAGALGQINFHGLGDLVEREVGRAGLLNQQPGGPSISEVTEQDQQQQQSLFGRVAGGEQQLLLPLAAPSSGFVPPPAFAPAALNAMQQQQQQQRLAEQQEAAAAAAKQKKVSDCVSALTEMGFEPELSELAAAETSGDLDAALALIESWQT
jgi:hypothetical protein